MKFVEKDLIDSTFAGVMAVTNGIANQEELPDRFLHEENDEWPEINDNIHGVIRLHPLLMKIIDTPQFQRLRGLKQLGMCDYVWPTATHSRFEHSIGVCHLAKEFIDVIRNKQPSLGITDKDQMCIMIAGLCHDLGHGPYSHTYDGRYIKMVRKDREHWQHEDASVEMLTYLFKQNPKIKQNLEEKLGFTDRDFKFIEECIQTKKGPEFAYEGRDKEQSFLYDFISNKGFSIDYHDGLDVDRFDYILRDSRALNLENVFGQQSMERLFWNARVMDLPDGSRRICYAANKVMKNLASVGSTRYRLHDVAYQHKTTTALELMICDILKLGGEHVEIEGDDGELYSVPNCIDNMGAYMELEDSIIDIIKREAQSIKKPVSQREKDLFAARSLILRIKSRDLYCHAATLENIPLTAEKADKLDPDTVKREVAAKGGFDAELVRCVSSNKDFGMAADLPLSKVMMFDHKNLNDPPVPVPESMYPPDLPKQYKFVSLVFFSCMRGDAGNKLIDKIHKGLEKWKAEESQWFKDKHQGEPNVFKRTLTPEKSFEPPTKMARSAKRNLTASFEMCSD